MRQGRDPGHGEAWRERSYLALDGAALWASSARTELGSLARRGEAWLRQGATGGERRLLVSCGGVEGLGGVAFYRPGAAHGRAAWTSSMSMLLGVLLRREMSGRRRARAQT